ncbi:MAG: hypothetical protein QF903_13280 [Planctomycetota bacterium]|jgi:hypothetical protein|nr:hypothetical protein [Planctomycetota bacterium]MDP6762848.1 hypothetical protein [Planctomycetota bacterium]MDP6990435.1 hypothetical protein [Planctomycetota bacterium]
MTNDDAPPDSAPAPDAGDPTERALGAHLPGLRLIDRDLCLDDRPIADFAGLIAGRPVLFLAIEGDDEAALLRTGDALGFARRHPDALAGHLGVDGAEEETGGTGRPPTARTVLLSDTPFSPALLERLAGLGEADLLVLQRRRLHSAVGESEFFVAVDVAPPSPGDRAATPAASPVALGREGAPEGARAFLAALPQALAVTGQTLIERIGRIDEGLMCRSPSPEGGLEWYDDGELLCSLRATDGHLEARLAGTDVPHSIRTLAGVDVFLDWLLTFHLERLGPPVESGELAEVELTPPTPGPILTPEEIEAFRE